MILYTMDIFPIAKYHHLLSTSVIGLMPAQEEMRDREAENSRQAASATKINNSSVI